MYCEQSSRLRYELYHYKQSRYLGKASSLVPLYNTLRFVAGNSSFTVFPAIFFLYFDRVTFQPEMVGGITCPDL